MKTNDIPDKYKNGWMSDLDARTSTARDMRERYSLLTNDLGGEANLSYQQRSLIERALWIEFYLAKQERELATGADFDSGRYTQSVNTLQGLYAKLGLARIKTEKSLADYLRKKESSK